MLRPSRLSSALALSFLALAGCGGGGDDTSSGSSPSSSSQVALTTANYASVTRSVLSNVGLTSSSTSLVSASGSQATASAATGTALPAASDPMTFTRYALAQAVARGQQQRKVQSQAVVAESSDCAYGGSLTLRFDDADNDGDVSAGDSLSIVADACLSQSDGVPVSGGMRLVVGEISDEVVSGTVEFTAFTAGTVTMNGAASIRVAGDEVELDYNALTVTDGSSTQVLDYKTTLSNGRSARIEGPVRIQQGTYTVSTVADIGFGSYYPNAGTLRIADGLGNRVDAALNAAGYTANLYLRGDEVVDATSTEAWQAVR